MGMFRNHLARSARFMYKADMPGRQSWSSYHSKIGCSSGLVPLREGTIAQVVEVGRDRHLGRSC
jgi:hypothetical protein